MTIITDTSYCQHQKMKELCSKCTPVKTIAGVLTIGKQCQWKGKLILHSADPVDTEDFPCGCARFPDDYVHAAPTSGALFTFDLVAIPRGADVKVISVTRKATIVKPMVKYLLQCRHCWPTRRQFKSEDGAYEHLETYHDIHPAFRFSEVVEL